MRKWHFPRGLTLDDVRSRIIDAGLLNRPIIKHEKYKVSGGKYYLNAIVLDRNEYVFMYDLDGTEWYDTRLRISVRQALNIIKEVTDGKA